MLLALALAALAPQPASAERACILDGLTIIQRHGLANAFEKGDMEKAAGIARPPADKCAATWKWSPVARDWQIVHSAAYAAMVSLEALLLDRVTYQRLQRMFARLSAADRMGLTLEGGAKLDETAYAALTRRVGALLLAEQLSGEDADAAGNWFIAHAQFSESDVRLKTLPAAR